LRVEGAEWRVALPATPLNAAAEALTTLVARRRATVRELGDIAYLHTKGKATDGAKIDDLFAQGLSALSSGLDWALHFGQKDFQETFLGWMRDPRNKERIRQAHEQGFGDLRIYTDGDGRVDTLGKAFYGGAAVWELFVSEQSGGSRA